MKKKLLAVILVAAMLISLFAISTINSAAASQYAQTSTPVEGGNMLHCMCWSYNTIKANLDDIKAAGYTAVQRIIMSMILRRATSGGIFISLLIFVLLTATTGSAPRRS